MTSFQLIYHKPDAFLIGNFKKYLENRRKKQKPSYPLRKIFRESDFKNWSKLMILPLLDLLIFGIEQEIQIPNRVLADAIYPSSERGRENYKKNSLSSCYEINKLANADSTIYTSST